MNSSWTAVVGIALVCLIFFAPLAWEMWAPEDWKGRWEPGDVTWGEEAK